MAAASILHIHGVLINTLMDVRLPAFAKKNTLLDEYIPNGIEFACSPLTLLTFREKGVSSGHLHEVSEFVIETGDMSFLL